jgi:short chain dehydrogenase
MNLEISGRRALVRAASKGLGKACAMALALEGVDVTVNARNRDALEAAAAEIEHAAGIPVSAAAYDISTPEGRDAALAGLPVIDILVSNAGGPPPGDFRDWSREFWIPALDANMLTPIARPPHDRRNDRAEVWAHRQSNLECGEGADPVPGAVERRPHRADRIRRRPCAPSRAPQRSDQQPAARLSRDRPPAGGAEILGTPIQRRSRSSGSRDAGTDSRSSLRIPRGVRADLRVPLRCVLRLYHRPEPAVERRLICRDLRLTCGVTKVRR